ncbi:MAG: PorV/PorQ family protein [Bacteroidales bacterium]|jgi:hypothetical protein|nr:PorV/PorQ family protein [Bacteroidales bacterium]
MKNIYRIFTLMMLGLLMIPNMLNAGNDDRRGTAGMPELLLNPWVRSAGWGSVNTACGKGIDALFSNAAGLGLNTGTEGYFTYSSLYKNSVSNIAFGLSQSLGEKYGVLGLSFTSMDYGTVEKTTEGSPEAGNNGTYSATTTSIAVSYAKGFSSAIYFGATVKLLTTGISNVTATGFAIDAGVQYRTGENYEYKFGIALKNWGPSMSYEGDGLSIDGLLGNSNHSQTVEQRSATFELPSSLNIGASYDLLFAENTNRITFAGNFASMAYSKDQYTLGIEYGFKSFFMLRAAYTYEAKGTEDIFPGGTGVGEEGTTNLVSGFSAGATASWPIKNKKTGRESIITIDYGFRSTKVFGGIHSIGVTFNI